MKYYWFSQKQFEFYERMSLIVGKEEKQCYRQRMKMFIDDKQYTEITNRDTPVSAWDDYQLVAVRND